MTYRPSVAPAVIAMTAMWVAILLQVPGPIGVGLALVMVAAGVWLGAMLGAW